MADEIGIKIVVDNAGAVIALDQTGKKLAEIGHVGQVVTKQTNELTTISGFFSNQLKSLTSTITALAASYIAYQVILNTGIKVFTSGIAAIDQYKTSIASLAGLLTSFSGAKDSRELAANYKDAKQYVEGLYPTIQKIGDATILENKQVQQIATEFLKRGQIIDSSNQKQVKGLETIANAMGTIFGSSLNEMQIRQEIGDLMDGQITANSTIGKTLERMDPLLKEHLKIWAEEGTSIENIGRLLKGFIPAGKDLENTWQAVSSTLKSTWETILRDGMEKSYANLVVSAKELNSWLKNNNEEIKQYIHGIGKIGVAAAKTGGFVLEMGNALGVGLANAVEDMSTLEKLMSIVTLQPFLTNVIKNIKPEKFQPTVDANISDPAIRERLLENMKKINKETKDNLELNEKIIEANKANVKLTEEWIIEAKKFNEINRQADMSPILIELDKVSSKYDEMRNKFGNRPLINSAQIAEEVKIVSNAMDKMNADIGKEIVDLLEEQKKSVEDVRDVTIKSYNKMASEYDKTTREIIKATKELANIQYSALQSRQSAEKMIFELETKNMDEYKRYKLEQKRLEEMLSTALKLSGEQKIKELEEYRQAAVQSGESASNSNNINLRSQKSVKTAIEQVKNAQEALNTEYKKLQKETEKEITLSEKWAKTLQKDMSIADKTIQSLNSRIASLNSEIEKEKNFKLSTDNAFDDILQLGQLLNEIFSHTYTLKVNTNETVNTKTLSDLTHGAYTQVVSQ